MTGQSSYFAQNKKKKTKTPLSHLIHFEMAPKDKYEKLEHANTFFKH